MTIEVHGVTPERWDDLVALFGPRGASSGCWCMWWRVGAKEWDANAGDGNRDALARLVADGRVPGLLAYSDGRPVGWCSVAPRAEFPRVERSPALRPLDDRPAWAVVCFYIDRRHRGRGVGRALLDAAVAHARAAGARLVEGYPSDPAGADISNAEAFTGVPALFEAAGFRRVDAGERPGRRVIYRKEVRPTPSPRARSRRGAAR